MIAENSEFYNFDRYRIGILLQQKSYYAPGASRNIDGIKIHFVYTTHARAGSVLMGNEHHHTNKRHSNLQGLDEGLYHNWYTDASSLNN